MPFAPYFGYLGYLAAALAFVSFFMKTPRRLRQVAIGSNIAYIAYGALAHQYPVLLLHCALMPVNILRLVQLERMLRHIRAAMDGEISEAWFHAFSTRHEFEAGADMFRKGDPAGPVYFVAEGVVELLEIEHRVGAGQLLGEMAIFAADRARSLTARAHTRVVAYSLGTDGLMALYHDNPQFALYLVQLITKRLLEDVHKLEAIIAERTTERERFRELAAIDDATGLPNEHALELRLGMEWGRATRVGAAPLSLIAISTGDERDASDALLARLAEVAVRCATRSCDLVARRERAIYALLPGTTRANAQLVAEEIEAGAAALGIRALCSIASSVPDRGAIAETLLFEADEALLQARLHREARAS